MKISSWALVSAMAGVLSAGAAFAQSGMQQPASVQLTAYETNNYDSYYAQDDAKSPSDQNAPAAVPAATTGGCEAAVGCEAGVGCGSCCDSCCDDCWIDRLATLGGRIDTCCKLGEPCKFFGDNEWLKCKGITVAGYLNYGFTANGDSPRDRFNGPVTFNDRSNEIEFNQLYIYAEKPTDTKGCGTDFGYRADLLYGSDSRFTTSRGLDAQSDGTPRFHSSRFYGLAIPQAYTEIAINDLKIKVGHFYTPIAYEVVMSNGNFFYSHALTHQYSEPFTHTGALATYTVDKTLSYNAGIVAGWDNSNSGRTAGIGGFTLTSEDTKRSLAYEAIEGDDTRFSLTDTTDRFMHSITYSAELSDKIKWVGEHDFGVQQAGKPGGLKNAYWYSLTSYTFYKVSDCFTWGLRNEWMRDEEGTRVAPTFGDPPFANTAAVGGFAGNFWVTTFGANWKPNANTTVRPEIRYDLFKGTLLNGVHPYDNGNDNHQLLMSCDLIHTF